MTRRERAFSYFERALQEIFRQVVPARMGDLQTLVATLASSKFETVPAEEIRTYKEQVKGIKYRSGTLADAIEWETVKLYARLRPEPHCDWPPVFRDRHVHIGSLIHLWRAVAKETEEQLLKQGYETFLDIGPWGGFNFVVENDGYTRMKFARLTLGVGSLPSTPLEEYGGLFFETFMPMYKDRLANEGLIIPEEWQYRNPKRDSSGQLVELSHTYYFPFHTYDHRTFVKVRLSREFETYEEIMLWDFLTLLTRLYYTTDWVDYKQETRDVDVRFDLQDFISLSHIMEGVYQRTDKEEQLLQEIKEAFRGAIREKKVLYEYFGRLVASKWIENLVWAIAGVVLGIKRFERAFSIQRDIMTYPLPPHLLVPVKCHVMAYHDRIGALRP